MTEIQRPGAYVREIAAQEQPVAVAPRHLQFDRYFFGIELRDAIGTTARAPVHSTRHPGRALIQQSCLVLECAASGALGSGSLWSSWVYREPGHISGRPLRRCCRALQSRNA